MDLLGLEDLESSVYRGKDGAVGREAPTMVARKQREKAVTISFFPCIYFICIPSYAPGPLLFPSTTLSGNTDQSRIVLNQPPSHFSIPQADYRVNHYKATEATQSQRKTTPVVR